MATKNNVCRSCLVRPIAGGRPNAYADKGTARSLDLCLPCLGAADWENVHGDDAHETTGAVDECWECHPELNQASESYTARTGTSREGMVITVPIRASAKDKAGAVIAQLPKSYATSVRTVKGITTLKAAKAKDEGLVLRWDAQGRFLSGEANGRKVRNVSEALRVLAA